MYMVANSLQVIVTLDNIDTWNVLHMLYTYFICLHVCNTDCEILQTSFTVLIVRFIAT